MKNRKLRIAWSVAWGVACLLLIVLWVRSWDKRDELYVNYFGTRSVGGWSWYGRIIVSAHAKTKATERFVTYVESGKPPRGSATPSEWRVIRDKAERHLGYDRHFFAIDSRSAHCVLFPHWFLVASTAVFTAAPWLQPNWRFTLRTLLIATTLVAVGLGWLVYMLRSSFPSAIGV